MLSAECYVNLCGNVCTLILIHILHFFSHTVICNSVSFDFYYVNDWCFRSYTCSKIWCSLWHLYNMFVVLSGKSKVDPSGEPGLTSGLYHRNYSGRWLVATMSASKSTSLMRDFTSLPELDIMSMSAVKSYLHSWWFSAHLGRFQTV